MARWMVAMDSRSSCSSGVPYAKLIPIQPSPMADTSKLLFPSLRFCIFKFLFQSEVKFLSQSEVKVILVRICRDGLTRSCSTCPDIARNCRSRCNGGVADAKGELFTISNLLYTMRA